MFDPFDQWRRYAAAGASLQATTLRAAKTMGGAGDVVSARSAIIGEALSSPLTADYAELGRIIPEKVEAISRSGSATASIWFDTQSAWLKHMQYLGTMTMRGRPPTAPELFDLGERGAALLLRSAEAAAKLGATALAPFSRQVGVNVRRLDGRTISPGRGRRKGSR